LTLVSAETIIVSMETESGGAYSGHRAAGQPAAALEAHLGYWLRLVSNEVSSAFERALQKRNISVAEWVAMSQLAAGTELTPAKLAAAMGMTRGAISKVLDKLDAKKLISRSVSPLDSRVQFLSLTAQARRILPQLTCIADDNDRHFFAALGPDQQASLRHLLRKLAEIHQMTRIPVE
jgi:DNA-binding MarR family transcriptional regulator